MYYYVLIVVVFMFSSSTMATRPINNSFFERMYTAGLTNAPLDNTPAEAKFAQTKDITAEETAALSAVLEVMKPTFRNFKDLRILHPEGALGFVGSFLKSRTVGTQVTVPLLEATHYDLSLELQNLEKRKDRSSLTTYRLDPKARSFEETLSYFAYNLVILDQLLIHWMKTKTFWNFKASLTKVAENTPFMLLTFPDRAGRGKSQEWKDAFSNPRLFFPEDGLTEVKKLEGTERSYVVIRKGVRVGDRQYQGALTLYKGGVGSGTWVGKERVVKQYWIDGEGSDRSFSFYENTLKFTANCKEKGLSFIPPILETRDEPGIKTIVMPNMGRNLFLVANERTESQVEDLIFQIINIFEILESFNMTSFDFKAGNFLESSQGAVILIDFDFAQFDQKPTVENFLSVCWGMINTDGKENLAWERPGYLWTLSPEQFSPVFAKFVRPVLEGKVKNFAELNSYLFNHELSSLPIKCQGQERAQQLKNLLRGEVEFYRGFKILHPFPEQFEMGLQFAQHRFSTTYVFRTTQDERSLRDIKAKIDKSEAEGLMGLIKTDEIEFISQLTYKHYDLLLGDELVKKWLATQSVEWVARKLRNIIENISYITIKLKKNKDSADLIRLLANPKMNGVGRAIVRVQVYPAEGCPDTVIILLKKGGVRLDQKCCEGRMIAYKSDSMHNTWIGPERVLKEYDFFNSAESKQEYANTIRFYERCQELGIDFVPALLDFRSSDRFGYIVTQLLGRDFYNISAVLTPHEIYDLALQLTKIFARLEAHQMNPVDLKGGNCVIDAQKKVYLIDFDQAQLGSKPSLIQYLNILLNMNNSAMSQQDYIKGNINCQPLSIYGPVLSQFAKPILDGTVKNFAELKAYVDNM